MTRVLTVVAITSCVFAQSPVGDSGPGMASTLIVNGTVKWARADDETPLPPDLRIAVECHGESSDGGGVGQSGQFRFTMTPSPLAIAADTICTIEARAFGYDAGTGKFPLRSSSGIVNAGTLTIQRSASARAQDRNSQERTARTVSATSLKAPPDAVKLFDRGMHSLQQGKYADAAKSFEAANKIYPNYAESWLNLGRAHLSLHSIASAHDAFVRAAELDPQLADAPEELGLLAAGQNDLATAVRYLDDSLRLDPALSFRACYSDAVVNLMLKRYDVAERAARAALQFGESGTQARANFVLGMALLATGDNIEAKQRLLRYLELNPKAPERTQIEMEFRRLDQLSVSK